RQITARALCISPELARSSASAAIAARASPGSPRRACVASIQPVTWLASACESASRDPRRSAALNSCSASLVVAAAGPQHAAHNVYKRSEEHTSELQSHL